MTKFVRSTVLLLISLLSSPFYITAFFASSTTSISELSLHSGKVQRFKTTVVRPSLNSIVKKRSMIATMSTASSSSTASYNAVPPVSPPNLLIVGCGYLGTLIGKIWKEKYGTTATVYAETATKTRHNELEKLGIIPFLPHERNQYIPYNPDMESSNPSSDLTQASENQKRQVNYVVVAVPPSKEEKYKEVIENAASSWTGEGAFVFTSSGGVYAEDCGGEVDETSALSTNPRLERIFEAEAATREAGGHVVRLAGLYDLHRGPHTFWLKQETVQGNPQGLINMVHYYDAARAVISTLLHKPKDLKTLLISDDKPMSRQQICEAAISSEVFGKNLSLPNFNYEPQVPVSVAKGDDLITPVPGQGKIYNTEVTRKALGDWTPMYPSFGVYMLTSGVTSSTLNENP